MAINVKQLIADTICELSQEKPLSKVTIGDIAKRSGIGRQTFYNHFKDKNDCIRWVFLQSLARVDLVEKEGYYAYLVDLYQKAQENGRFLKSACLLTGQNSLAEEIYKITYKFHRKYVAGIIGEDHIDQRIEFALRFDSYGSTNCYIQWLLKDMPMSPEDIARFALESMPQIIQKYFV